MKVQLPLAGAFLFAEPPFELLGSVGRSIIENEGHRVDLPPKGFGNDLLLHEGLEINKAFALAAGSVDLAIGNGESGKQMACASTIIASFVQRRLACARWTRRLLAFACLDRGFLVQADQPGPCSQKGSRLAIGLQDWASPF